MKISKQRLPNVIYNTYPTKMNGYVKIKMNQKINDIWNRQISLNTVQRKTNL